MAPFEHKETWKSVSNVGSHSFQPFNLPLQMPIATRANMPILNAICYFPSREGLEKVEKFVPKNFNQYEFLNFQDTQKEDVQVVVPFKP